VPRRRCRRPPSAVRPFASRDSPATIGARKRATSSGVYEELTRAGIVIDRFDGTSLGAIAAAGFALGMDAQETIAVARVIAQSNPLGDYMISCSGGHARLTRRLLGGEIRRRRHLDRADVALPPGPGDVASRP
jgi:hypothetical protein